MPENAPSSAKVYADALTYISSPTMGLPGGRDALDYVDEASEANVRLALKACIRTARMALQNAPMQECPTCPAVLVNGVCTALCGPATNAPRESCPTPLPVVVGDGAREGDLSGLREPGVAPSGPSQTGHTTADSAKASPSTAPTSGGASDA